jgi:hypothetical protein
MQHIVSYKLLVAVHKMDLTVYANKDSQVSSSWLTKKVIGLQYFQTILRGLRK